MIIRIDGHDQYDENKQIDFFLYSYDVHYISPENIMLRVGSQEVVVKKRDLEKALLVL